MQAILSITEEKEVGGREIGQVWQVCGELQPIFGTESVTLLSIVRCCIVRMNNEVSLASLWAKPDEFREVIATIVFCIRTPALWKSLGQVKLQSTP
jgi:hypothetical protein